jgi:radical SAM protein with 4Fe4S-binding SPASM domain
VSGGSGEIEYRDFSARICQRSLADCLPARVQFELTYRCNIHCVHCYTDPFNVASHLRGELKTGEILRLFDETADAGVLWLTLTGGEAVLHPQFRLLYQEARRRGFIISLYTNATTITESLADFLAAEPPFTIDVSCHGASDDTFDRVTQVPGSFRLFLQGVGRMLARGLPVAMRTKAMTINRHELDRIRALVEGFGLSFQVFTTIHPRLDGDLSSTLYRLQPREVVELEVPGGPGGDSGGDSCGEASATHAEILAAPGDDRLFRCGCGTNSATISPHGVLRACTHTTWPAFDLAEMPFRQAFQRLVQAVQSARYTGDSPCRPCRVYSLCSKNPAMAVHESGSMEAPVAHYCEVAFGKAARLAWKQPA